ncbi:MAG: YqcI/YcgG family protein, partial [Chitinophagales bacterium]|nr:YqcI/YcgG family protein [Hyphomicrobiales bacterium]
TPAMVFNLHDQFEQLRSSGAYEKMRETILKRDAAVAGSINPMLSQFGETSEARQYSGRVVNENWVCPFSGRSLNKADDT